MPNVPRTALQIRSLVKTNGELELSLAEFEVAEPEIVAPVPVSRNGPSGMGDQVQASPLWHACSDQICASSTSADRQLWRRYRGREST